MSLTLSVTARKTLLNLAEARQLERFSEADAGELAARGYAVRRSRRLVVTDDGLRAARHFVERSRIASATLVVDDVDVPPR